MARTLIAPIGTGALLAVIAALTLTGPAWAAINVPSDGSDGAFNPTAHIEVDLSQAVTGTWSDNNAANAGKGIYDPQKWAVVFKYSSVDIPAGVTVTFKNHPSGAPVVWLVQSDTTIAGTVNLDGENGQSVGGYASPGPGGFSGGAGITAFKPRAAGFGPGGGSIIGNPNGAGGGYGTAGTNFSGGIPGLTYGNARIMPLIGGSGATGWQAGNTDGGAGGGIILLACGSEITLTGSITANGGYTHPSDPIYGSGGGGGIRLICDALSGTGQLTARGGGLYARGGDGRIRIECNSLSYAGSPTPAVSASVPLLADPAVWPPASIPSITITQIAGGAAPVDPYANLTNPDHYISIDFAPTKPIIVKLNATNVPLDWLVKLRVVPFNAEDFTVDAVSVSGDATASVWEATITAAVGVSALQARASKP